MTLIAAIAVGIVGGLAVGLGLIGTIHRTIWGHWRFWDNTPGSRR